LSTSTSPCWEKAKQSQNAPTFNFLEPEVLPVATKSFSEKSLQEIDRYVALVTSTCGDKFKRLFEQEVEGDIDAMENLPTPASSIRSMSPKIATTPDSRSARKKKVPIAISISTLEITKKKTSSNKKTYETLRAFSRPPEKISYHPTSGSSSKMASNLILTSAFPIR
jgi:hypothetical protein